jgi:hypothetical protein
MNWADIFHHMANPASAGLALVPESSERQVAHLLETFEQKIALPFAPDGGAHGLVFGEWGHGKSQVLYRVAQFMAAHADRCLTLPLVPENLTPEGVLSAAVGAARKQHWDEAMLRAAVAYVRDLGTGPEAIREAAGALANWAADTGKRHTALLFDEAQTLGGAEAYQLQLQELRTAFDERQIVLHTLQCHSMVSLDRARELGQALAWLQGPNVCQIYLSSLDPEQTEQLLRARVATVLVGDGEVDAFFASGWTETVCRLVGGNPRKTLLLAQTVAQAMAARGATTPTGEDVITAAAREAGPFPASRLFNPDRLSTICELLPQVWPRVLGEGMAVQLRIRIDAWFGESKAIDIAEVAVQMNKSVTELATVIKRPVAGLELFAVQTDTVIGITTLSLSPELWEYLSTSFSHGGGIDDKQAQFKLLLAPGAMQREVADALSIPIGQAHNWDAFEAAAMPTPVQLDVDAQQIPLRGYRALVKAEGAPEFVQVLIAPMLGKVEWPEPARRAIEKRLRDQFVVRVILLDFLIVEEPSGPPWPNEPVEKSRIARIDYRRWGEIEHDITRQEDQSLSVKAARLCAATLGHAAALGRGLEPNDWQEKAVGQLLHLIGGALPAAVEFTFLPNGTQRQILDHPAWSESDAGSLNLRQMGNGVTSNVIMYLVPHYLIKEGTRWRRQPALGTPLAKLIRETLKRARDPVTEPGLADVARKELLLAQRDELAACISWLVAKFVEAGEIERRLEGLVFVDRDAEIRQLRREIAQAQRKGKDELERLKMLRREQWVALKAKSERIIVPDFSGQALYEALLVVKSDHSGLQGEIATAINQAEQEIERLVADSSNRSNALKGRGDKAHVIWREALGLDTRFRELHEAVAAVKNAQGSNQIDRYSAARDAHATFEGRYQSLSRLFDLRNDAPPREQLAALGLGNEFQAVTVSYIGDAQ